MYALAVVLASGYGSRSGSASWSASWSGSWSWSASSESVEGAGEACQRQLSSAGGGGESDGRLWTPTSVGTAETEVEAEAEAPCASVIGESFFWVADW